MVFCDDIRAKTFYLFVYVFWRCDLTTLLKKKLKITHTYIYGAPLKIDKYEDPQSGLKKKASI
jgi:hypothetical protein